MDQRGDWVTARCLSLCLIPDPASQWHLRLCPGMSWLQEKGEKKARWGFPTGISEDVRSTGVLAEQCQLRQNWDQGQWPLGQTDTLQPLYLQLEQRTQQAKHQQGHLQWTQQSMLAVLGSSRIWGNFHTTKNEWNNSKNWFVIVVTVQVWPVKSRILKRKKKEIPNVPLSQNYNERGKSQSLSLLAASGISSVHWEFYLLPLTCFITWKLEFTSVIHSYPQGELKTNL